MRYHRWKLGDKRVQPQGSEDPPPPLAEQHRIVAKMDELMALCDQLEAQLTTTEADSRRLLEAVLHEAFHPPPGGQPTVGIGYR